MSSPFTRSGNTPHGHARATKGQVSIPRANHLAKARDIKRLKNADKKDYVEKYALPHTERRKLWSLLNAVAKLLNANQIDYIVAWGLLLGITRDKDFIPHDDDVDLVLNSPLELFLGIDWKAAGITIYMPTPGDDYIVSLAYSENHAREFPFIEFYSPAFDESTTVLARSPSSLTEVPLSPWRQRPIPLSMPSNPEAVHVFLSYWYGSDYETVVTVYPTHRPWAANTAVDDRVAAWPAFCAGTGAPKRTKRKRSSKSDPNQLN